jgi:hypothetical protein
LKPQRRTAAANRSGSKRKKPDAKSGFFFAFDVNLRPEQ